MILLSREEFPYTTKPCPADESVALQGANQAAFLDSRHVKPFIALPHITRTSSRKKQFLFFSATSTTLCATSDLPPCEKKRRRFVGQIIYEYAQDIFSISSSEKKRSCRVCCRLYGFRLMRFYEMYRILSKYISYLVVNIPI